MRMRTFMKPTPLVSAFLCGAILACSEFQEKPIVTVGSTEITTQDLRYRVAIETAYGGNTLAPHTALVALINDGIASEVANGLGLGPTDQDIQAFIEHVERTTQAPEILQAVKDLFGEDRASYVRVYLKPKIVEQKLQHYQAFDTVEQSEARQVIQLAYKLAAEGKNFREVAQKVGGRFSLDTFDLLDNSIDQEKADNPLAALAQEHLQPGVLFQQVVEDYYTYSIVRLVDQNKHRNILESVAVSKKGYDGWLPRHAGTVPVVILDKALIDSVQKHHSNVWWVEKEMDIGRNPSSK